MNKPQQRDAMDAWRRLYEALNRSRAESDRRFPYKSGDDRLDVLFPRLDPNPRGKGKA
jgi:hypothetical protein